MSEINGCYGCDNNSSKCLPARDRIAEELGIFCTGSQRGESVISTIKSGNTGLSIETAITPIVCPLILSLEKKLMNEGLNHNSRKQLLDLILANRINSDLPLDQAVKAVADNQSSPEYSYFDSRDCFTKVKVLEILHLATVSTIK